MKTIAAKVSSIATIILALVGEANVQAQTNGSTNLTPYAEKTEVNQKHEDTKKLIEILGLQGNAKSTLPKIVAVLKPDFPQVPDKFWAEFQSESNLQKCVGFYVKAYEKNFTHEDIKGMIKFYSTPLGEKIIAATPRITQDIMEMSQKMGIELEEQVEKEASGRRTNASIASKTILTKDSALPPIKLSNDTRVRL